MFQIGLTELPPWLKEPYQKMIQRGEELSQMQYPRYEGPTITPFTKPTLQALELSKQTGEHVPFYRAAQEQLQKGAETFPEHYEKYMNPYIKNVIEQLANVGGRTLRENIFPQLEAQFVGLGQERSTRHDELRARHARDLEEAILREQQKALMSGYGEAGKQFNEEKIRQLEAGRRQAELGRYAQAGKIGDIEQLMHAGQLEQAQAQNVANEARQEYLRQAYYPHQMLQQQMGLMQGVPQQGITSQAMYNPAPQVAQVNIPGQMGAAAMGLYGASQMGQGRKAGGSIKSPRLKKPFGLSSLKFKSSNKPQKHMKMKFKNPHEGSF